NRQYKDRMFDRIFRIPENLLSLFNALNGTAWTDADQLEIHAIAGVIYICIHGDLVFVWMNRMNLWEHQSTWNPNMPARGLLYFAQAYQRYVVMHSVNLLSKGLKKLPFPQYFVFFNGLEEEADRRILKFSDAFIGMGQITNQDGVPLIPALEIQAVMININLGRNEALMKECPVLREYAQFVAKTRENIGRHLSAEEAVKKAVNDCINEGILRDLLISWKAEDINMIIEEFTEEEMWELNMKEIEEEATAKGMAKGMEIGRAEGRTEGQAVGRMEGILDTLIALVHDGLISVKDAALRANLTEEVFISRMGTIEK
ncbi:MAG: hypothetical protein LUC94_06425, partial [Clostridiales bacterium]|nr:hypothetical protein [Clostridiales bacterium]